MLEFHLTSIRIERIVVNFSWGAIFPPLRRISIDRFYRLLLSLLFELHLIEFERLEARDDACKFELEFAHKFHRQRIFSSLSLRFCSGFLRFAQFARIFPSNLIISSSVEILRPRGFILSSLTRIAVRSIFPFLAFIEFGLSAFSLESIGKHSSMLCVCREVTHEREFLISIKYWPGRNSYFNVNIV